MLSFKPAFALSYFTLTSCPLSAARVVSSACLTSIFLPAVLIPAYDSSNPAFCVIHSAYKLNKHGDNIQPSTPFPIKTQPVVGSGSDYCFLTHIQVSQETGKVVWYSRLFKSFPQFVVIHAVKVLDSVCPKIWKTQQWL